jgi:REP element-mobilizing transposase RayT
MTTPTGLHNRHSLRLPGYDYARTGAYFVTVVTQHRAVLFGTVAHDVITLSPAGDMLHVQWQALPARFPTVTLDAFIVMPNHIHGLLLLADPMGTATTRDPVGASLVDAPGVDAPGVDAPGVDAPGVNGVPTRGTPTVGDVVGAWKSLTTVAYIDGIKHAGWPPFAGRLWQRNYYEHIVRDDDDLVRIRHYILTNPHHWADDAENML